MKNDEFNFVEIKNERDGFSNFEFGHTQNDETISFNDNRNNFRDEVNDNPTSNNENKKKESKRREERKDESKDTNNESKESSEGSSSNSSSGASSASSAGGVSAVGAAVAAAVSVAIGIVSVGAGPFSPEVDKVLLTPHETSINCAFDIFNNDSLVKYKVELYNDGIDAHFEKESQIGHNELEFTDLVSSTEYTFEIFRGNSNEQQEYTYESIYSEVVSTLESTGSIVLSFDSNERQGTMSSIELDANESYTLPVSIFVPRDDEYFAGWKINGEGEMLQPGQTVSLDNDATLVAGWNKFPAQETVVPAGSNFFRYFPTEPSPTINTIHLMDVDFKYQYTSYASASEALLLSSTGGFVSASTPFGGPISKISITTDSTQSGEVNYTVVFSEYPIYEKATEGGETKTLDSYSTYAFDCNNPEARYFCLSNESSDIDARIMTIEFTYLLPVIENSFQVYFDANGGTGTFGPYTVSNTNREELPNIDDIGFEAPEGYEFAGWKVKGVNDLLDIGTLIGISSDITLVAQWQPMEPKTNYTITFDPNGGSFGSLTDIEAEPGEVVNLPDRYDLTSIVPPSNYYAYFAGWSEEPAGLDPVEYSYTVNGDTTLYAIWGYGYDLHDDFDQFESCGGQEQKADTTIANKGTFIYHGFERVSSMFFMGNGDQCYFSNVTETAQPIKSIVVTFGGPIAVSVTFGESSLDNYNYVSEGAHEYNPPQYGTESHEFTAPTNVACRYFNISSADSDSTTIVSNIIIKYR